MEVDVLEYHKRAKVVNHGLKLLHDVYEFGLKAPAEYYRALLVLSFQFTEMDCLDDALRILDLIPPTYFRNTLPEQMADDPFLMTIARRTAEALVIERHVAEPGFNSPLPIQDTGVA